MREYGLYYQGALLSPDCFDASRLFRYLLEAYDIPLSEELARNLEDGDLTDELRLILCDTFFIEGEMYTSLDEYKEEVFHSSPEIFEMMEEMLNRVSGLSFKHLTDITADFYFSDGRGSESLTQADMLAFYTPIAWRPRDEAQPSSYDEAISWLNLAGQPVFQDDVDWGSRLGELIGSVYG